MEFEIFILKFNDAGEGLGLKLENDILECSINLESEDTKDLKRFFLIKFLIILWKQEN